MAGGLGVIAGASPDTGDAVGAGPGFAEGVGDAEGPGVGCRVQALVKMISVRPGAVVTVTIDTAWDSPPFTCTVVS